MPVCSFGTAIMPCRTPTGISARAILIINASYVAVL
nr:MAG TPA: hypothetical protein [Caudoviricetes sp.]